MTETTITAQVAAHVASAAAIALPPEVAQKAQLHLLDTLAAIISGTRLKAGRKAMAFIQGQTGPAQSCVPGTPILTTAIDAAFAAAMAAHADETDDSHLGGRFHPGCAVVPAALAVADHRRRSGAELLRAVACGYDIGARATIALGFSGPRSGTHSTHCLGANFGAAAAAGALAGLTPAQAEHLLSYATQQASGIAYWQRDSEHVEKAFDFGGMGARNGVFGALFVASGASGCTGSLTGPFSYLSAFGENPDPEALAAGLGSRFEIMAASIKKWCVGSPIQAALDSVMALIASDGLTAADVVALRAIMPDDRLTIVDNRDMPDVCLQHLLALALVDGELSFASTHDKGRMQDPRVLDLREKITAIPSPELTEARPARQAIIEIDTKDGRHLRHRTFAVLGTPDNPMRPEEVEAKARDLIAPVLGADQTGRLIEAVRDIERLADVRDLRPLLMTDGAA
ncbi:MmgE/PrpD family protein [Halovulum dunhuangense]|uniref:MmgE/PrpD family protein n=1 Tax=Halovulum dunhuangense TaxID=1505036 RepID=A0A849L1R1_9RHOB|nr:MmgE/PrpD family protein [Halovulum dunhuangense]NNU80179.1 MmgE/PrpD family protein [Halovulum dunhuangense]